MIWKPFYPLHLFLMVLALIVVAIFTTVFQPGALSISAFMDIGSMKADDPLAIILWDLRLPRLVAGILAGGALAVSGLILQLLVRNPLAEPYILGLSSGASVGAILPIVIGVGYTWVQIGGAFSGVLLVTAIVYLIGMRFGRLVPLRLLMGGVMVGAFLTAVIFILFQFAGDGLRTAISWLLGNLSLAPGNLIYSFILPIALVVIGLLLIGFRMNNLALGEEVARQVGVNVENLKKISYLAVSILTGLAVCLGGIIGFVGLVVPHILRSYYGPDFRFLIPASFLTGGILLIIADWVAKSILYPVELPVGAITALIGAPYFVYLLRKQG